MAARDEALQRETYAAERATRMGDALGVLKSERARLLAPNAALTERADAAAVAADASLRSHVRSQTDSFLTTAAARNAALVSANARLEAHVSRLESEEAALAAKYERVARLMPRDEWAPPSERAEEFGPQFWETAPGKKAGTAVSRPAWRARTLLAAQKRYRNALFGVSGAKWELARLATSSSKAIELLFEFPRFRKVLKRILELAHKKEALSLDQLAAQWLAKARVGIGVGRLERLVHQMLEEYSVEKKKYEMEVIALLLVELKSVFVSLHFDGGQESAEGLLIFGYAYGIISIKYFICIHSLYSVFFQFQICIRMYISE